MTGGSTLRRLGLALAVVGIACTPALARTPTGEVQAIMAEANKVLSDPATEGRPQDRVSAILDLVDRSFAFREAAAVALGHSWRRLTPGGQAEFVALFADLIERAFVMTLASKARLDDGLEVNYRSESITRREATVLTTIVARDGNDLPLGYRMVRRDERWLVADVILDGVSFVGNYRAQFERVIRLSSYQELVARMRARSLDAPEWWPNPRPTRVRQATADVRALVDPPTAVATDATGTNSVAAASLERRLAPEPVQPVDQAPSRMPAEPRESAARSPAPSNGRPGPEVSAQAGARKPAPAETRESPSDGLRSVASLATPPVSAPVRGRITYWLQAGAFRDAERASRLKSALLALNLTVSTSPAEVPAGTGRVRVTRVRVGSFLDRSAALTTLAELRRLGYAPFLAVERQ